MASLTLFLGGTQGSTRPSTKPEVSCLAVFTQAGVLPPDLWLAFLNLVRPRLEERRGARKEDLDA